MRIREGLIGLSLAWIGMSSAAQTVTSSGATGTVGNVPRISAATSTSTTLGTSPISISGSNVGIGTTSPQNLLQVYGGPGWFAQTAASNTWYTNLRLGQFSGSTTIESVQLKTQDATNGNGYLNFYGQRYAQGFNLTRGSSAGEKTIAAFFGGTTTPSSMTLYDQDAQTQRLYFTTAGNSYFNGGNVGIGTTSPTHPLDVQGAIGTA